MVDQVSGNATLKVVEDSATLKIVEDGIVTDLPDCHEHHMRLLKWSIKNELRNRCHRQVNKRLSLELALYHLDGSRADQFWRANWKLGELHERFAKATVGG